jgi:hypothetical protein
VGYPSPDKIENDNNLLSYCGRSEFNVGVGVRIEVEWRSRLEPSKSNGYQNRYLN